MTPDESTTYRKNISLISQIAGSAAKEGRQIVRLAREFAKANINPTATRVADALGELQARAPMKSALLETTAGGIAGGGMIYSVDGLEAAWPDAPEWAKQVVMAGGGVLAPVVAIGVAPAVKSLLTDAPIISFPAQIVRGVMEMFTSKGIQKAAARSIQTTQGADPSDILNIRQQLLLAQVAGRNIDETTRVAYTLPQMARNEARILEAQLNAKRGQLEPDLIKAEETLHFGMKSTVCTQRIFLIEPKR